MLSTILIPKVECLKSYRNLCLAVNLSFPISKIITGVWSVAELLDTGDITALLPCVEAKCLQWGAHGKKHRLSPQTDPRGPKYQKIRFLLISERSGQHQLICQQKVDSIISFYSLKIILYFLLDYPLYCLLYIVFSSNCKEEEAFLGIFDGIF